MARKKASRTDRTRPRVRPALRDIRKLQISLARDLLAAETAAQHILEWNGQRPEAGPRLTDDKRQARRVESLARSALAQLEATRAVERRFEYRATPTARKAVK